MDDAYTQVVWALERAHHAFLGMVKSYLELTGIRDINNVQAMILVNVGDGEMTIGELIIRGCYLGSNVSYNVKKLVQNGYFNSRRGETDRRATHIMISDKGREFRRLMLKAFAEHTEYLLNEQTGPDNDADLARTARTLLLLDRFLADFGLGPIV